MCREDAIDSFYVPVKPFQVALYAFMTLQLRMLHGIKHFKNYVDQAVLDHLRRDDKVQFTDMNELFLHLFGEKNIAAGCISKFTKHGKQESFTNAVVLPLRNFLRINLGMIQCDGCGTLPRGGSHCYACPECSATVRHCPNNEACAKRALAAHKKLSVHTRKKYAGVKL
jgi:hypothetical protein